MKKLGAIGRGWLRSFHIFFVCTWIGAVVSARMIPLAMGNAADGAELFGYHAAIDFLDSAVIVPSAIACLITGVLLSWLTPWGFFKYRWVIYSEVVLVVLIMLGILFLGPWTDQLTAIAKAEGLRALQNPAYQNISQMRGILGIIQILLFVSAAFVSSIKPWGKREKAQVTA